MTDAPIIHGGYSARQVAARARDHRRRMRRGLRVRAADLDPITTELLRHYSEGAARCDLLPGDSGDAWTAFNSTARALRRLEDRLKEVGLDRQPAKQNPSVDDLLAERRIP